MELVNILVVDDERVVALDIRNTLERLGYAVPVVAVSGEEAVRKAREFSPDLVLMDVRLKGAMDGIQAAKAIHQSLGIPIIYLTAHSDEETMRRALDAGPFGYLIKPFQERELHSTIEIALYKHREEKELIKAREVAEEEGLARSLFMANVSHEVRTALNGIVGMAELALDTDLTEEQKDYLETVLRSSESLARVVNDVLEFSKIQSKRLKLTAKPFDLEEVLLRQIKAVEPRSRSKGLRLTWRIASGVPRKLVGDPVRLGQVLANLLGNAVKFTNAGGVAAEVNLVEVSARREEALAPQFDPLAEVRLLFSVRDTGIGIPSGKQELVFETFQQAAADTSEKYGGAGLGLAICKELAEMMGGDVWLRSREGLGSTFYCTLSFKLQSVEVEGPVRQHVQLPLPPLKVLVVDDNVVSRKLAARLLEKRGHESTCVADAETALEMLGKRHFDIVLMDIEMGDMDGMEATARIRQGRVPGPAPTTPTIPVVAVTAHALHGDRERFLRAGMDGYLAKPFSAADFHRTMELVMTGRDASESEPQQPSSLREAGGRPEGWPKGSLEVDEALARLGGDAALLGEIWAAFRADAPHRLSVLGAALTEGNKDRVCSLAFALQGACANVGAGEAGDVAMQLAHAVREDRLDDAVSLWTELEAAVNAALKAMATGVSAGGGAIGHG